MSRHPVPLYGLAACLVLLLAGMAWAWHSGGYGAREVLATLRASQHHTAAPLVLVLVYVAGGFAMFPVMLLIAVTGLVYGPVAGALYALLGAATSGACGYAAGRYLTRGVLERYAGERVTAVRRRLRARGLWAVILVRVVPSGPYTLVNLVAGASGIRFRDFMLGTVIGLAPGAALTVGLVHGAGAVWPNVSGYAAAIVLGAAAVLALRHAVRRMLARRRTTLSDLAAAPGAGSVVNECRIPKAAAVVNSAKADRRRQKHDGVLG